MFECTLAQGELFKKIIMALSDLVSEGNFIVDSHHISFQGMDSSHVSLVSLLLREQGFEPFRCDRDLTLGINFESLNKILKCMSSKDKLSIQCQDDDDSIMFQFEDENQRQVSNFALKLMEIDSEQLGIPETEYDTTFRLPSVQFQKICRDLSAIGDSITIATTKHGIKFSVSGDIGNGEMLLKGIMKHDEESNNDSNETPGNDNNNNNDNSNSNDIKVKSEDNRMNDENDGDVDIDTEAQAHNNNNQENEEDDNAMENDEEEENDNNNNNSNNKSNNNDSNIGNVDDDEDDDDEIVIHLNRAVQQTFALRYLNNFTKATGLSKCVKIYLGTEVPMKVEYKMDDIGYISYYLAPKIDDEE